MLLRTVRVTLNEGKYNDYWAWAKEIVDLWNSANVVQGGGPYALKGAGGEDVALWVTIHPSEDECTDLFRKLYATEEGARLISLRPPLVKETTTAWYAEWDRTQPAPPAPNFA